ncbi:uncharacterized protein EAE97_004506 [Botrytis byssoidea]|uniref:Uncharacterized protein n=1 Tax=Botrytis byssoidea TaxID=139641 RepID=A0A9P5IMT2_9HELO|nr:uncharacterized protein EAE97_004506 [Botrytis byssoidea]KAF7947257.1 hypothetical protein EAE97_004506 [Botrytis byssoidea]
MPVTIKVAKHDAEAFKPNWRDLPQPGFKTNAVPVQDPDRSFLRDLLQDLAPKKPKAPKDSKSNSTIIQSTLTEEIASKILPSGNGLVHTCLEAYNQHRHLVLRPDDIWIAIVTQFSFYVNKHSEELRSFFVAHEGKKELVVVQNHFDFTSFTTEMANMIQDNIVDKSFQSWILPAFSTTTRIDNIVCSSVMMSAMKKYFDYRCEILCGIPTVTLLGEISDWEEILRRLDKLEFFGPAHQELIHWKEMLAPVIQNMILTFENPGAIAQVDFWSKIVHVYNLSGGSSLTGWLTVFCLFNEDGDWQGGDRSSGQNTFSTREPPKYPIIKIQDIPTGKCEVNVRISGDMNVNAMIVAGLVGASVSSQNGDDETLDTVQPYPAWCIFELNDDM